VRGYLGSNASTIVSSPWVHRCLIINGDMFPSSKGRVLTDPSVFAVFSPSKIKC
jgi:hypothetical protein